MIVNTRCVNLLEPDYMFNQDKLYKLQKELDEVVGYAKSAITIEREAPYSSGGDLYSIVIWAICLDETENKEIIKKK